MKEDFEKNIESKLSDFKLEPSPQVWLDVEDALLQSRKRKIAGLWWIILPVFLFLVSGGIWWMNNKTVTSSSKIAPVLNLKNINAGRYKQNTNSSITGNTVVNSNVRAKRVKANQANAGEIRIIDNRKEKLATKNQPGNRQLFTEDQQGNTNNSGNTKDVLVAQKDSSIDNLSTKENATNFRQCWCFPPTLNEKPVGDNIQQGRAVGGAMGPLRRKNDYNRVKNNKPHWFITASGGFMNVKEGTSFFSSNTYASSPTLSTGASTGGNATSRSIPAANNGYSFGIGFLYSQPINKRWEASIGVQYQYLQNKQPVGLDSFPLNSALTYFSNIQSVGTKSNYAHWLQLPVSLQYTINPSSKYHLALSGGGSIAWAFSEQWLITDKTNTSYPYHYNSSLNNRFIANLHAGIGLNCNDKFRLSLLAEQSLTPIHKNTTDKFYWQQFSLQISKPLHLSSHQNKKPKT